MKLFNSVQELWNYCGFCPLCRKKCRDIEVSVGPDKNFKLEDLRKDSSTLWLRCGLKNKQNYYMVEYLFDCSNNTFKVDLTNVQTGSWFGAYNSCPLKNKLLDEQKVKEQYFYFYIQSSCKECHNSRAYSSDLELDISTGKVSNIELERESFYLVKSKDKFHMSLIHDRNIMLVTRCYEDNDGTLCESDKTIELPLVKFDFSNQDRVIDKIKTFILFS